MTRRQRATVYNVRQKANVGHLSSKVIRASMTSWATNPSVPRVHSRAVLRKHPARTSFHDGDLIPSFAVTPTALTTFVAALLARLVAGLVGLLLRLALLPVHWQQRAQLVVRRASAGARRKDQTRRLGGSRSSTPYCTASATLSSGRSGGSRSTGAWPPATRSLEARDQVHRGGRRRLPSCPAAGGRVVRRTLAART